VPSSRWVVAAELSSLPEAGKLAVYPKGLATLLVRRDDELYAVANRCAHMACPLDRGRLDGYVLECPCHDWRFDVRDGRLLDAPEISLPTFPVKIEGEHVLVELLGA